MSGFSSVLVLIVSFGIVLLVYNFIVVTVNVLHVLFVLWFTVVTVTFYIFDQGLLKPSSRYPTHVCESSLHYATIIFPITININY